MVDEPFARWRRLNFGLNFTPTKISSISCSSSRLCIPETIYFDTRAMREIYRLLGQ